MIFELDMLWDTRGVLIATLIETPGSSQWALPIAAFQQIHDWTPADC